MDSEANQAVVIGSTGFLGSELVAQEQGMVLCNRTVVPECAFPQVHVNDLESLSAKDIKRVYLLAAHIPYGQPDVITSPLVAANVELVARVCRHFRESRIIYSSSVSVYGSAASLPISEDSAFERPGAYGLSKLAGEVIVQAHPNHCVLRYSSLYGPGMTAPTFLPLIVKKALAEGLITLCGPGTRLQNYLHVSDAARMLTSASESSHNGVFNAVDVRSYSNIEVARLIAEAVGDVSIKHVGSDSSPSFSYDNSKWNDSFQFAPRVELEQGIEGLVDSCRQNNV